MEIIKLIDKNLKIMFRSKISSLIILIGPLLIILLAGIAFNNTAAYDIRVGVFSESYSPTAERFVDTLNQSFEIVEFPQEDLCIKSVESRGYHGCLVIPPNLQIGEGQKNSISLYVDNSRINIVDFIEQKVYLSIQDTSQTISSEITDVLIQTIILTRQEVQKSKDIIKSELERNQDIRERSNSAQRLQENSNLQFDKKALNLKNLSNISTEATNDYNTLDKIAGDSINEFENSIAGIDDLNLSINSLNKKIGDAEDTIVILDQRRDDFTQNASITELVSITGNLVTTLDSLDKNLKEARTNQDQVKNHLNTIREGLDSSDTEFANVLDSFGKINEQISANEILQAENIVRPVNLEKVPLVTGSRLNQLFPSLIILIVMLVAILMGSAQTIQEKMNKAHLRMSMTPISIWKNLGAQFLSVILVILAQIILIMIAIQLSFGINIAGQFFSLLISTTLIASLFTIIGMILGSLFNSEQSTLFAAISVSSIFFITSDLILPIESMSETIISLTNLSPFVLATDVLRKIMFFDSGLAIASHQLIILYLAITLALISLAIYIKEYKQRKAAEESIE